MAQQGILAVLLLLTQGLPGSQSDICAVNGDPRVSSLLIQMLQSFNPADTPNPSILLGLRLARDHNLEVERAMVQRLKEDAVHRVANNLDFTSGTVALYVMALQASCENPRTVSAPNATSTVDLVQLLNDKYEEELRSMGREMNSTGKFGEQPAGGPESIDEAERRPPPGPGNTPGDFGGQPPRGREPEKDGKRRPKWGRIGRRSKDSEEEENRNEDHDEGHQKDSEAEKDHDENHSKDHDENHSKDHDEDHSKDHDENHSKDHDEDHRKDHDKDSDEKEDSDEGHDEDHDKEKHKQPLTNYYQMGLNIMALCLQGVSVNLTNVRLEASCPEQCDGSEEKFSVDTAAVMVLGLTCVANRKDLSPIDWMAVNSTLKCLVQKILRSEQEDGVIGNIYSTGLAMQALSVALDYYGSSDWNCSQAQSAALDAISKGKFSNPMAASQITPSLQGRTYLDVSGLNCSADQDNLPIVSTPPNPIVSNLSEIFVNYAVIDNVSHSFNNVLDLNVPAGSSFLAVMEAAQSVNPQQFSFTTESTAYGPLVVSINGLAADAAAKTFWQLQSGSTPLNQGVADYKPQNGELLAAVLTTWQ